MNRFLTIYRQDYNQKHVGESFKKKDHSEFRFPIRESFRSYLQLSSNKNELVPPVEDADVYTDKLRDEYPKLGVRYFDTHTNNELMERIFIYDGRTTYQTDYCDLLKDRAYKDELMRKNMFRLPNDYDVPLTTHSNIYRDPVSINPEAREPRIQKRLQNNLDPDEHIRKILKVTTGISEVQDIIGGLGTAIMDDELHGKIIRE